MLIGVTGRAQHGKDSLGRMLVEGWGFERYAFADTLKSMALALDPIVLLTKDEMDEIDVKKSTWRLSEFVWLVEWDQAKKAAEVRRFLQALGTEGVRDHIGEDAWVQAVEQQLVRKGLVKYAYFPAEGSLVDDAHVVVTDVRFPNEAAWVQRMGGKLLRVKRVAWGPYGEEPSPYDNGLGADHPSEKFVDDLPADHELVAENLTELRKSLEFVMRRMVRE